MRWQLLPCDDAAAAQLAAAAHLHPLVARLLVQRGISTPEAAAAFLAPALAQLHSPYLMTGMREAITRLEAAIARREKILIYGDYDVDGTTAVVILKTAIELCGGAADFHVPHRIREGYGMRDEVIERAADDGIRLIISVDTGIRAFVAADTARRLGVDLLVTDHHLPEAGALPAALAVLNPNQPGCGYPCKALCGAGVAFKIAQALLEKNGRERLVPSFLKMAAIATIADAVPLVGENRVITRLGLEGLRDPRNLGLRALMEAAGADLTRRLTATDVAFRLAPRLNAAGRMDVARDVVDLFTVRDPERARQIAARLNQLNTDRQQEEARIVEEVRARLDADPAAREPYCLVLDGDGWHRGVIGIVATRVVERYRRPALVCSRDEAGEAHGSGRSIPAFHLLDALESCRGLFNRFGGHAHAVGFALPAERLPQLREALDRYARARLTPADFEPVIRIDAELPIAEITPDLYRAVCDMEPFGMDNPEPVFSDRRARITLPPRVLKDKHLKLRLAPSGVPHPREARVGGSDSLAGLAARSAATQPSLRAIDAIGWRMAERFFTSRVAPDVSSGEAAPSTAAVGERGFSPAYAQPQPSGASAPAPPALSLSPGDLLDVAYRIDYNSHPDFGGLQMVLVDLIPS